MDHPIPIRTLRYVGYLLAATGLLVALWLSLAARPVAHAASSVSIFALTTNNTLVQFNSATPGTIISTVPISGILGSENIVGIDFQPGTGQLFAAAFNGASDHVYVIDPGTGVATVVNASSFTPTLSGTSFGFDFNPVANRIRTVADTDQNMRLNPITGLVAGSDVLLDYTTGDPNDAANPNVVGAGYTNNVAGAITTTLYVIDSTLNILARQGGVGGAPSPNGGQLTTIGLLGFVTSPLVGLDIAWDGTAFASLTDPGGGTTNSKLFTINLATRAATFVGTIGDAGTGRIRGLAIPTLKGVYLPIVLK